MAIDDRSEWLETDGLGGFTSGTVSGIRTRRYHALLLAATTPPTGRFVLVNGFDAWVETPRGSFALTSQRYTPDVVHPDGARRMERFDAEPWPRWSFRLEDGTRIEQEIVLQHGEPLAGLRWRLETPAAAGEVRLCVRLFFSGRDYHALHHENAGFRFDPENRGRHLRFRPYPGVPDVHVLSNADYRHASDWYRNFLYTEERDRGLDAVEDLASPGIWSWDLGAAEAVLLLSTSADALAGPAVSPEPAPALSVSRPSIPTGPDAVTRFGALRAAESARRG